MEDKLTLSVEEAAKVLGIGRNLCYDRVRTGEIPVIKIVLGLSFAIVISGYVFLLRILIRPNSVKIKARQVRVIVTVVMTIGLVTLAIHTFRFLPSPEAAHPLSQVLAILLLAALVSAYPVILRYIWYVWKPGKGII